MCILMYSASKNVVTYLRSLKMAPFDRSHTTYHWFVIVNMVLYCTVFQLFDVEYSWPRNLNYKSVSHWRPFKLVPFKILGAVFYSTSIVTMAVSLTVYEIFSGKEERDLENWVRACSRSLRMAPFDRSYTTFYWSAIVNILYRFWLIWRWIISGPWNVG